MAMLKRLQVIYRALLMGQLLFLIIVIIVRQQALFSFAANPGVEKMLQLVALVLAFAGYYAGIKNFQRRTERLRAATATPTDKMKAYTAVSIFCWALGEAPVLFSLVCYLLSGNWVFIIFAMLLLFIFAGFFPAKHKVLRELALTETDLLDE